MLKELKFFLETNTSAHFTIKQLAKKSLLNEYKLKYGFKKLFHTALFAFHFKLRINAAKKQLRTTDLTIDSIAVNIGYRSLPAFINAFKKSTGQTPGAYRRKFYK